MIPEYKYRCKNDSIITPPFKKYMVSPLINFIPWKVPANIITIISSSCLYIALFLNFFQITDHRMMFLITPLLFLMFAIGDHLDGMQAKRTQTSSALGEFCDHYLDILNNGIMLMSLFLVYGITNTYLVVAIFVTSYVAHASIFYEQYKTKWLVFEKIGSLEGIFLIIFIILAGYFEPVYKLLTMNIFKEIQIIEIILWGNTIGPIFTGYKALSRTGQISKKFITFTFLLILTGVCSAVYYSVTMIFIMITLFSCYYIGNLQRGHLTGKTETWPDFILPVFLILSVFLNYNQNRFALISITIYLICMVAWSMFTIFYPLRLFWVWKNPPHEKV